MTGPLVRWLPEAGLWWPVEDADPLKNWRFHKGRAKDSDVAVSRCVGRKVCVQAGAWVGLWPRRLARSFGWVLGFEPMPGCFEAAQRNCAGLPNVKLWPLALGEARGFEGLSPRGTAGSWRLDPAGSERAAVISLDSLELRDCDAIILDIEGGEVAALKGAVETIARHRPVIMVEELPRARAAIFAHMSLIGYREAARVHGDAVYVPDERA